MTIFNYETKLFLYSNASFDWYIKTKNIKAALGAAFIFNINSCYLEAEKRGLETKSSLKVQRQKHCLVRLLSLGFVKFASLTRTEVNRR